ncbi:MAG: GNAT family N-acetyltransferase [Verrucomicrobiales bacterium]
MGEDVVAGGGIYLGETGEESFLYMGMVRRDLHRHGLGTLLMLARLTWTIGDPGLVWVMTHEKTRGFYEKFGFERIELPPEDEPYPGFTWYGLWLDNSTRQKMGVLLRSCHFLDLTAAEPSEQASGGQPATGSENVR